MSTYKPPHGFLDDLLTWSKSGMEKNAEENEAYDRGWQAGKAAQDQSEGRHSPPHGFLDDLTTWSKSGMDKNTKENETYDRAWHESKGRSDARRK